MVALYNGGLHTSPYLCCFHGVLKHTCKPIHNYRPKGASVSAPHPPYTQLIMGGGGGGGGTIAEAPLLRHLLSPM